MPRSRVGRIFEHFVLLGLKTDKGLLPFNGLLEGISDIEDSDLQNLVSPLQQTYQASVYAHYPYKDLLTKLDHQAVTTLCFPHGVSLYEHPPEEGSQFHPFIITREDGSKVHGAALTFYEQVRDDGILDQINTLCKEFHKELQKTSVGRLSSYRPLQQVYAAKCMCFVMSLPFHRASEASLLHLHKMAMKLSGSLPLESYIYNLLYEVQLPPPARSSRLFVGKRNMSCYRPGGQELPLLDYPLSTVLSMLGPKQLITLVNCVLLEQRVLVTSCNYYRLMLVCESISALLFPFNWAHVYVPILPASMQHFLDAPVPFIMGLYKKGSDQDSEEFTSCEMCRVDLESCTVEPPEELPTFPHSAEMAEELHQLAAKYKIVLEGRSEMHDSESGMNSQDGISLKDHRLTEIKSDIIKLGSSSRLAELEAIVKGVGVISSIEGNLQEVLDEKKQKEADDYKERQMKNKALQDTNQQKFSECVREVFFNSQLRLFGHYEKFVIYPSQCDMASWLCSREMISNFDKESFLGDQPGIRQPFLCRFLETQMFATFIDNKIMSQWQDPDNAVKVFDLRNSAKVAEVGEDHQQKAIYEKLENTAAIDAMVDKRSVSADYVALAPHILEGLEEMCDRVDGQFPELNSQVLVPPASDDDQEDILTALVSKRPSNGEAPVMDRKELHRQPSLAFVRKNSTVSEAYIQFVDALLKEIKVKTKRMLVGKMGEEAVQLGHADPTLLGLEENTMIASLCDLLERIWSHGVTHKQSKSPLWAHLQEFSQLTNMVSWTQMVDTFTPKAAEPGAFTAVLISAGMRLLYDFNVSNFLPAEAADKVLTHRRKGSNPERPRVLEPLPDNLLVDVKHIQEMKDIKTDIGRARAFIRLSLEKKLLAAHFKELLANQELLKSLYKGVAFLRCEDEREQALYHLLSLNTADFRCFTNAFTSTELSYRVLVVPGKRFAGGISTTTANAWISVAGKLRDSDRKWLPKNVYDFSFESKNLGQLSTVRIGHDNSGLAPKWLIDHVIVRNETTGLITRFPCGRWLGRGVDDDSTERILVGETITYSQIIDTQSDTSQSFPGRQKDSPKPVRRPSTIKRSKSHMQQVLSDSVNRLLKYVHKPEKERESVTLLLCGDSGLCTTLETMLSLGFKSSRFFRNNLYIWDYLENVHRYLLTHDLEPCRSLVANITIINNSLQDVGKDGKLQLLLCIAVRDHLLPEWLTYLHYCPITKQMYDNDAFLLDEPQVQFLVNLVSMLRSYHISLEPSITQGLDI
ncbi:DENN domain-containing protein 5B-like isoform X2 [Watersipora subatra]|uniref:DENN domain-containing protein 5B-like isoform X2 n=1 Tax=Watersipora subatra TaxID=2589382 RepID=UPI00355BD42B